MKLQKWNSFLNENKSAENEVVKFLTKQMEKDRSEYTGNMPNEYSPGFKWKDSGWLIDEIICFLSKKYLTSYTLMKFGKKYDYETLNYILRENFKKEYNYVISNFELSNSN